MARGKGKGSQYERDLCRRLSDWWSNGKADDWFWRSSNSGGRATVRSRKGKQTFGQYGDIAAVNPKGRSLLRLFTIEVKRGYNKTKCNLSDLLDVPDNGAVQELAKWIKQARRSARQAGSKYWLLIHKKDGRREVVYMPSDAWDTIWPHVQFGKRLFPFTLRLEGQIQFGSKLVRLDIVGLPLDRMLAASPKAIRQLHGGRG